MKISGKGVIVIILLLVVIPLLAYIILVTVLPKQTSGNFTMMKFLFSGYRKFIPLYIGYLIVAFAILYLIRFQRQRDGPNQE